MSLKSKGQKKGGSPTQAEPPSKTGDDSPRSEQPEKKESPSETTEAATKKENPPAKNEKPPSATEDVEIPPGHTLIEEGSVKMLLPKGTAQKEGQNSVFYNPVQIQNRDLSILMIALHKERVAAKRRDANKKRKPPPSDYRILDALAASGLRSIRYHKEIPVDPSLPQTVVINDIEEEAVRIAAETLELNSVSDDPGISVRRSCALEHMYGNPDGYDAIDLDPYGSCTTFLDAALRAVRDGGMLCVTSTDMVTLSGAHPETCFGRYGSMPIPKGRYLHENALRILQHALHATAARYGKTVVPILSVGMAFYVRIFVEVRTDKAAVTDLSLETGMLYQSTRCDSFYTHPLGTRKENVYQPGRIGGDSGRPSSCESTGAPFKIGGPIWLGRLHDFDVVKEAARRLESDKSYLPFISTRTPLHGLLVSVSEELPDVPLYYVLPSMCKVLHCQAPKLVEVYNALENAGYKVSAQHKEPDAIKTDAPPEVVWDVLRYWVKKHPVSKKWLTGNNKDSAAAKILAQEPKLEIKFGGKGMLKRHQKKAQRYPQNPTKFWGPKPKATGKRKLEQNNDVKIDAEQDESPKTDQPPNKK